MLVSGNIYYTISLTSAGTASNRARIEQPQQQNQRRPTRQLVGRCCGLLVRWTFGRIIRPPPLSSLKTFVVVYIFLSGDAIFQFSFGRRPRKLARPGSLNMLTIFENSWWRKSQRWTTIEMHISSCVNPCHDRKLLSKQKFRLTIEFRDILPKKSKQKFHESNPNNDLCIILSNFENHITNISNQIVMKDEHFLPSCQIQLQTLATCYCYHYFCCATSTICANSAIAFWS